MNSIYKHSGRFTLIGVVAGLAAGLAAGLPLAFIYAWGIIRIPEEKLCCFATLTYGALIGAAVAVAGKWGKVRNVQIAALVAICATAASYYFSWAFWVKDIFHRFGQDELNAIALMLRPHALWKLVKLINEYGTWGTTAGNATKGTELWVIWAAEAVAVLGAAALTAVAVLRSQPFCEKCDLWCSDSEKLCLLPVNDVNQTKLLLAQHDLSFLQKLGPGDKKTSHLIAELHSCPSCRELNTLTLRQTLMQPRKFGSPQIKHVSLVDKLVVSRQEADAFRLTAHNVTQLSKAAHA